MTTRYLEKFTSEDGTISITFPLFSYEYTATQPLRLPTRQIAGGHYAYPLRGNQVALKDVGTESAKLVQVVDEDFGELDDWTDEVRLAVYTAALGWIYTLADDGTRRRARAQLTAMPEFTIGYQQGLSVPATINFTRFTDFQNPALETVPINLNATSQTFDFSTLGNAPVYDAVIELVGLFTNPKITNYTTGYILQSTRDGADFNDHLRFDAGQNAVEFSETNGLSYVPDWVNFVRAPRQIQLMRLAGGVMNQFLYEDSGPTADSVLTFRYYPHWH